MGGVTSTRVTRPSAVTQNRTSWRRPRASRGAPGGGKIVHRGEAGKISLALPPEPAPESAPTPVPVPVPRPPPEPGPCPAPPVVPAPVPTAADGGGAMTTAGGGTSMLTGSVAGTAIVGTVTAGGCGMSCACAAEIAGNANQLTAGRPPPPPPPRAPEPPPPPSNNAAPRHSPRIALVRCATNDSAAARPSRRRGSGSA